MGQMSFWFGKSAASEAPKDAAAVQQVTSSLEALATATGSAGQGASLGAFARHSSSRTSQLPAEHAKYPITRLPCSSSSGLDLRASLPLSSPEAPSSPHIPASPAASMSEPGHRNSLEGVFRELLRQATEDKQALELRLQDSIDRSADFCHQVRNASLAGCYSRGAC